MHPAEQTANENKIMHVVVTHQKDGQKDDEQGEGHETAGKMMYRDGTMRWESR